MKFLLDENVPRSIQKLLQDKGHSVTTLDVINKRGITNGAVAMLSIELNAIIITFDSDFLKIKKSLENKIRAIYIELHPRDPEIAREILDTNLISCLNHLKDPGIIILTKNNARLKDK